MSSPYQLDSIISVSSPRITLSTLQDLMKMADSDSHQSLIVNYPEEYPSMALTAKSLQSTADQGIHLLSPKTELFIHGDTVELSVSRGQMIQGVPWEFLNNTLAITELFQQLLPVTSQLLFASGGISTSGVMEFSTFPSMMISLKLPESGN